MVVNSEGRCRYGNETGTGQNHNFYSNRLQRFLLFGKKIKRYGTVNGDSLKRYALEEKLRYGTVG